MFAVWDCSTLLTICLLHRSCPVT